MIFQELLRSAIWLIDYYEEKQRKINRETFCQNCESWIYIENCKNCLFNVLCAYEIPDIQDSSDL